MRRRPRARSSKRSASARASGIIRGSFPAANSSASRSRAPSSRRPALLFADEPTGNLDTHTGQAIIDLLFALNEDAGTTLVLVTHDEHLAARCRHQIRLDSGRLVE